MATTIEVPAGRDALTEFVLFHDQVYARRAAHWRAALPFQLPVLTGESPFASGRTLHPLVAREDGRVVARILAVVDHRYQRHWNERLGHLVMFEALPGSRGAVRLLMDAACEWLAGAGANAARAGLGMLEFPFVIDDYETLPPLFMRQNPSYYHALLKDAGFETEKGLVDYRARIRPELTARWESMVEAVRRAGFALMRLGDVPEHRRVSDFTRAYNDAFASHWGIVPFSEDEFASVITLLTPLGMLEHSLVAYREREAVGVLWVSPDASALARRAPGRALLDVEKVNFLGIGVHASARGRGVNLALAAHAYLDFARRGATHVSYTLVLDDNWPSRRTAEKLGAEVCASYVVYRRSFRG